MLFEKLPEAGMGDQKIVPHDLRRLLIESFSNVGVRGQKFVEREDIRTQQGATRDARDVAVNEEMTLDLERAGRSPAFA